VVLKPTSLTVYARSIGKFCTEQEINPFDFPKIGLEAIEDMTETYIISHVDTLAPKYLNVIYNAIKTWCFVLRMIKNRKLFREIKFDKQSHKMDAMTEQPLETKHIRQLMMVSDAHEKILLGLYALCALRPSLIPQLKVKDFHPDDYRLENEKIEFKTKNPFLHVPKKYEGNKGHITFFVILPSKITELVEYCLNANGKVTLQTPILTKYRSYSAIFDKISRMFETIVFEGRPYLLRTYGDRTFDKTLNDKDLKEFMMGHRGKISQLYQMKALTTEDKQTYLKDYAATEKWIDENVFGVRSQEQLSQAEAVRRFAVSIGANEDVTNRLLEDLRQGKLSMSAYETEMKGQTNITLETRMKTQFEKLFLEMQEKHNSNQQKKS